MLLKDTGTVPECPTGKGYAHKKLSTKCSTQNSVAQVKKRATLFISGKEGMGY